MALCRWIIFVVMCIPTVFDPRFPHGVREVRGTRDPLKARLVIHGARMHTAWGWLRAGRSSSASSRFVGEHHRPLLLRCADQARSCCAGWFSDPSPFFTGALTEEEATPVLNEVLQSLFEELQTEVGNVTGGVATPCAHAVTPSTTEMPI